MTPAERTNPKIAKPRSTFEPCVSRSIFLTLLPPFFTRLAWLVARSGDRRRFALSRPDLRYRINETRYRKPLGRLTASSTSEPFHGKVYLIRLQLLVKPSSVDCSDDLLH